MTDVPSITASDSYSENMATVTSRGRRKADSAEVDDEGAGDFCPKKFEKDPSDSAKLIKVLEPHYLFKHLDDRELNQLVELMEPKSFTPGSVLNKGADVDLSLFHVILEGTCDVLVNDNAVNTLSPLNTFGETAMLYTHGCDEVVKSVTDVRTCSIDRRTYQRSLHSTFAQKRALYCEFLKNVKFLEGLSNAELVQLADCLEGQKFNAGDTLIHCGAAPDAMYIIMEGTISVVGRDEKDNKLHVCEFTRGAIVGEMEFLNNHNNVADVVAKSDEVRVARLERKHFELCMGPVKDLLKSCREVDPVYAYYNKKRALSMCETPFDPEKGTVLDVDSRRQAYTFVGHVKKLMLQGDNRVTLRGVGVAANVAVVSADRLRQAKLVTFHRIETCLSSRGVAGIQIVLDKCPDFAGRVAAADAAEAAEASE